MTDIRVDGAWKAVSYAEAYIDGAWRRITRSEVYTGGAWEAGETYTDPFSVTLSSDTAAGFTAGGGLAVSNEITVTPAGGLAPYTYLWTRTGGLGDISSPTSATTTFSGTPGYLGSLTGDFICTVTDSLGSVAVSSTVTLYLEDLGGF